MSSTHVQKPLGLPKMNFRNDFDPDDDYRELKTIKGNMVLNPDDDENEEDQEEEAEDQEAEDQEAEAEVTNRQQPLGLPKMNFDRHRKSTPKRNAKPVQTNAGNNGCLGLPPRMFGNRRR